MSVVWQVSRIATTANAIPDAAGMNGTNIVGESFQHLHSSDIHSHNSRSAEVLDSVKHILATTPAVADKKLSCRRETARQLRICT